MQTHNTSMNISVGRNMAASRRRSLKPAALITVSSLKRSRLASPTMLPSRAITGARLTSSPGSTAAV